jgi:hypothetical protein
VRSVTVGVGVMVAAVVGATVLGVGVEATRSPTPPAAPTVTELDRPAVAEPSRSKARVAPTHDPISAAGDYAEHMRTFAPPTPSPTPDVVVDEQEQPPPTATASPSAGKTGVGDGSLAGMWPGATSVWLDQPEWVVEWAKCNVRYESWNVDPSPYVAENPVSTASGVGQWLDGTWASQMAGAGVSGDPSHAANNSPETQDRVLAWAARFAYGAWTHGCPRY